MIRLPKFYQQLPQQRIESSILPILITIFLVLWSVTGWTRDNYGALRQNMIKTINEMARVTEIETGRKAFEQRVMEVLAQVPRHEFVPADKVVYAYENRPLPIGYGQTISQPYIVALMTDLLEVKPSDIVLEVGTGSGYQAAILANLVNKVYSIEIIEELGQQAQERFQRLGYHNVTVQVGDGYYGWEELAPFDAIIVTAAANHIPPPLVRQLKPNGKMIIPVGERFQTQYLTLLEKDQQGNVTTRHVLPVAFVPLTRGGH